MTTTTAEQLDLSRLPPFNLVEADEPARLAALKAGIAAEFEAAGVPFELGSIETDSSSFIAREVAYRESLCIDAVNEAGKRHSLTWGYGPSLDQAAAFYFADIGLRRLPLVTSPRGTSDEYPEDWESNARFALRISLAPEARSFGTLGSYEYLALTVAPHLIDALCLNHSSGLCAPGELVLIVLGRDPDPDPATARPAEEEPAQLALVQAALLDVDRGRSTDTVSLRPARRVRVARGYKLGVRRGPDLTLVKATARTAYAAYADRTRRPAMVDERDRYIGKLLAESGEKAALKVGGVEWVRPTLPGSGLDIDPGIDGVVAVDLLTLDTELIGG